MLKSSIKWYGREIRDEVGYREEKEKGQGAPLLNARVATNYGRLNGVLIPPPLKAT